MSITETQVARMPKLIHNEKVRREERRCSTNMFNKKLNQKSTVKVKMCGPQGEGGGRGGRRGEEEGWREEGADDDNDELIASELNALTKYV